METEYRFTVVLEPEEEGGFTVRVPALPEIVTFGADEAEALTMAEDAIRLAIEYRLDCNEPIPSGREPQLKEVKVAVPA